MNEHTLLSNHGWYPVDQGFIWWTKPGRDMAMQLPVALREVAKEAIQSAESLVSVLLPLGLPQDADVCIQQAVAYLHDATAALEVGR